MFSVSSHFNFSRNNISCEAMSYLSHKL